MAVLCVNIWYLSMDRIKERALLFDIYGNLLTDHQKKIYSDVVENDFSLSEIGEEIGISRQGVHDLIKRCDKILQGYEDKLHLVEKFMHIRDDVKKINELANEATEDNLSKICDISNDILEEL